MTERLGVTGFLKSMLNGGCRLHSRRKENDYGKGRCGMIEITEIEAETLADTIEMYIYDIIRDNEDIDNINWLANIMSVYEKCKNGR